MMNKRTKIVATLGPTSETMALITKLVNAGLNVARLNFSHGTFRNHAALIRRVRAVSEKLKTPVAILLDLPGPKIRVGELPKTGLVLKAKTMIAFDTSLEKYQRGFIPVAYDRLHECVGAGDRLLLDDGRMETVVEEVVGTKILARVVQGGTLLSHKGINIPDAQTAIPALTEKDRAAVRFGVEHGVDFFALSFVTQAADILELRSLVEVYQKEFNPRETAPIKIIAKIERQDAVKNAREILAAADGIMVARGDLGIEIAAAEVPLVQKQLIDWALAAAKPVIVATQMLDSMQHNPRPTRAEVSDVANAVIDHADALMLSNETASGDFPVETVTTMATVIAKVESSTYDNLSEPAPIEPGTGSIHEAVANVARTLAEQVGAKLIVTTAETGDTGRLIARSRPELPIVVVTDSSRVLRQLQLSWGVWPIQASFNHSVENILKQITIRLKERQLVAVGDRIVVVANEPVGETQHGNFLEVREIV